MKNKKEEIKKVIVGLDLSDMDNILIDYSKFLAEKWNFEKIIFTHNIKKTDLYDLWDDFLKEEKIPIERLIHREIEEKVNKRFKTDFPYQIEVTAENYTEAVLRKQVRENDIDLLILGKKQDLRGSGSLAHKLLNLLNCDLLFVPEEVDFKLEKVLLPTDFTPNSSKAFRKALYFEEKQNWEITALHVFSIPSIYFPYIDRDKAIDKAKNHVQNRFKNFSKRYDLREFPFILVYKEDLSVVESIISKSRKNDIDLIMLSAKGGNKITSLFVGRTTGDLLLNDANLPIYVVK